MDYQLIDFGESRKLERFGDWIIDRPSPAASTYRRKRESAWNEAHARFDAAQKQWFHTDADQSTWRQERRIVSFGLIEMPVAPTPFGHVGVFPEQHGNWQWLQDVKPRAEPSIKPSARNALN
ncbi:MAG: SAM-dependent methyltransferase, partial [Planctomycetota bacterium]